MIMMVQLSDRATPSRLRFRFRELPGTCVGQCGPSAPAELRSTRARLSGLDPVARWSSRVVHWCSQLVTGEWGDGRRPGRSGSGGGGPGVVPAQGPVGSSTIGGLPGEPGVGKTRLARNLVETARDDGFIAGWGTASDSRARRRTWCWSQMLRRLGEPIDLGILARERGLVPELSWIAPNLVERAGSGSRDNGVFR